MIKHIFQIPFTGKTPKGDNMKQEWYDKRTAIFKKYTLKSLQNQTNKDFLVWVTFRPQDKNNANTFEILESLKGLNFIATFNGTMFTEDRATWHNKDLIERLDLTLPEIKKFVGETDYIYETNLDSDDMVHKDFSEIVQSKEFKNKGALFMKNGYAYNTQGRVADWHNPTSNQNYTIMFPSRVYFDTVARLDYLDGFKSHEEIPDKFNAEQLPDGLYCTVIHGDNISTIWEHQFRGQEYYSEEEKDNILKNFI